MITLGASGGYSDAATLDVDFPSLNSQPLVSSYIYVATAGDLIWMNSIGELQWLPGAAIGYHPICAKRLVSAGTVRGTPRLTTASGFTFIASGQY